MARQFLQDGPYVDTSTGDALAANTATTAVDAWDGKSYTPIFANDAKAGKIYWIHASGLITTGASGTLTIGLGMGTSSPGTTMGASIAQTTPVSSLSGPWIMDIYIVIRTITTRGAATSTAMADGLFTSGGVAATANSGMSITFGGTSCSFDVNADNFITVQKTLSVAGSWTTRHAWITALN